MVITEDTVVGAVVVPLDIFVKDLIWVSLFSSITLSAFAAKIHFVVGFNIGCLRRDPQGLAGSSVKLVDLVLSGEGSRLDANGLILSTITFSGSEISSPRSSCNVTNTHISFKLISLRKGDYRDAKL